METYQRTPWQVIKALVPFVWLPGRMDLKVRIVIAVAAVLLAKSVRVSAPVFYQQSVDALTSQQGIAMAILALPVILILGYAGARLGAELLGFLRSIVYARVREALSRALSVRIFRHLHELSNRFHTERRTGALMRVVDRGIAPVSFLLSVILFQIGPSIFELILVVILLANQFGSDYVYVTLATVAAFVAYTFWVSDWRKHLRRELNDIQTDTGGKAVDSILNYETVKYFANEDYEFRRYDEATANLEAASVKWAYSDVILSGGQAVILTIALATLMLMAGFDVADGTMTVGGFVMINALIIQLYGPLHSLGFVYRQIQEAFIDTERLLDVMDVMPEVKDAPNAKPLVVGKGEVRFDKVAFHYSPDRQILREVSFTIPPGKTVAVVGPTGAGKSTLSRLLFRLYDVVGGRITIDGQDLREVSQESLRQAIGMVPQDTVLFNDTIGYNIRYGRTEASDREVERAAQLAQIDQFIEDLPDRYDALVGERGLKLSGGEKQRVAIARTLLKNPPILILDEATSALDTQTEREIQAALHEVSRDRTTLVIAHRLSTVMDADEIIVLSNKGISERGTHAELLASGGLYATMWARQEDLANAERQLAAAREAHDAAGTAPGEG